MRLGIALDLSDLNHRLPVTPYFRVILIDIVAPDISGIKHRPLRNIGVMGYRDEVAACGVTGLL